MLNLLELQEDFLKGLTKKGRSTNTVKNYKTDLECFNQFLREKSNPNLKLNELTDTQVKEYGSYLDHRYNSDNSRRRRVQALRIFFDYLVEHQHFKENPVRKIPTSPKFLDVPRPAPFVEIKTLWEYLCSDTTGSELEELLRMRNQLLILLIFGSGLKVSDIAKLKQTHIQTDGEPRVLIVPNKRDPYTIPMPEITQNLMKKYLEKLEKQKAVAKVNFEEILFNANPYRILSGGLSPRGIEIVFDDFRKKLVISMTPKSLRQACIFKWLHQKHEDTTIKEWLGVAPSYSLKAYRDDMFDHAYSDGFLKEVYLHQDKKRKS